VTTVANVCRLQPITPKCRSDASEIVAAPPGRDASRAQPLGVLIAGIIGAILSAYQIPV
jgi:hypothetical protein